MHEIPEESENEGEGESESGSSSGSGGGSESGEAELATDDPFADLFTTAGSLLNANEESIVLESSPLQV